MNVVTEAPVASLRDVRGPSATGGTARRFFNLTWLFATTSFKLNYFGTAFGYLWSLARPLMLFGVLYTVFTKILRFGGTIPHYPQLLLFDIMLFSFFADSTAQAVGSVLSNESVVRKMQFPRLVIPLSVVLEGLFNLGLNLVVVLLFLPVTGVGPYWTWLALPLLVAAMTLITLGTALLLSALYVRFRDIAHIWGVLSLVIFYGSPVLYTVEQIPSSMHFLLLLNPFVPLFESARKLIVDPGAPSVTDAAGSVMGYVGPAIVVLVVLVVGLRVFMREAPRIAEEL